MCIIKNDSRRKLINISWKTIRIKTISFLFDTKNDSRRKLINISWKKIRIKTISFLFDWMASEYWRRKHRLVPFQSPFTDSRINGRHILVTWWSFLKNIIAPIVAKTWGLGHTKSEYAYHKITGGSEQTFKDVKSFIHIGVIFTN